MVCEVIKIGRDCAFMTRKGCSFNGGKCYPVVDRCQGCERVAVFPAGQYCIACPIRQQNGLPVVAICQRTSRKRRLLRSSNLWIL